MSITGNALRAMKERKLSQAGLARALGVPQKTVNNWFLGKTEMPVSVISETADYIGVSIDYLMTGGDTDGIEENPAVEDDGGKWAEFAKVYRQLSPEQQALLYGTAKEMRRKK